MKNQWKCTWFNFRYALVELFLDKPLKIIFLMDEGNERRRFN